MKGNIEFSQPIVQEIYGNRRGEFVFWSRGGSVKYTKKRNKIVIVDMSLYKIFVGDQWRDIFCRRSGMKLVVSRLRLFFHRSLNCGFITTTLLYTPYHKHNARPCVTSCYQPLRYIVLPALPSHHVTSPCVTSCHLHSILSLPAGIKTCRVRLANLRVW